MRRGFTIKGLNGDAHCYWGIKGYPSGFAGLVVVGGVEFYLDSAVVIPTPTSLWGSPFSSELLLGLLYCFTGICGYYCLKLDAIFGSRYFEARGLVKNVGFDRNFLRIIFSEQGHEMSQENYEIVRNIKRKPMVVLFTVIGGCCMLQFFVVGIINVIRGYSIGSYWPTGILLAGIVIFILLLAKYRKNSAIASSYSYVISFVIIYFCLIGFSQGKYRQKATKCYIDGQYQQALEACEKEVGPWYHLLKYNSHERVAMDIMAKAYCQLEDFDRAGDIYKLMTARYSGEFYGGRAEANLEDLEKGLEVIAYYPDNLASMPKTDYMRDKKRNVDAEYFELVALCNVVGAYKSYLHCDSKAREVYTEFLEKDVSDERNTLAIEDSIMKGRESRVGGEL